MIVKGYLFSLFLLKMMKSLNTISLHTIIQYKCIAQKISSSVTTVSASITAHTVAPWHLDVSNVVIIILLQIAQEKTNISQLTLPTAMVSIRQITVDVRPFLFIGKLLLPSSLKLSRLLLQITHCISYKSTWCLGETAQNFFQLWSFKCKQTTMCW